MSLSQALVGTKVIETVYNYARADDPLQSRAQLLIDSKPHEAPHTLLREETFWHNVFSAPSSAWDTVFHLDCLRLSEWVARVPGLAWKPESASLRDSVKHAQKVIGDYAYDPYTRSARVIGGVGTLRLPPGEDGSRLATLVWSGDVAAGVPVLMSADVWERIQKDHSCEGRVITGEARWVPMSLGWATHFPVIRDLPRGYLLLSNPDTVAVIDERAQTYIAPFSIMEYERDASTLFDYVYVGVCTDEHDYRTQVINFFDRYHKDVSPHAQYLIAGDMVQPMWDAAFLSPAELRRLDAGAKSQLSLLEARVREHMLGKQVIASLLNKLGDTIYKSDGLKVLSDEVGLKMALWFVGGTMTEQISQFVDAVVHHDKLDALIVQLTVRYPRLFAASEEEQTHGDTHLGQ